MDSIVGMLWLLIILSPFILLIRSIKKKEEKGKKSKEIFDSIVKKEGIIVTKDLYMSWNKNYQYFLIDDQNEKLYYMTLDKKSLSNLNIKNINYTDLIRAELIHNSHIETIDSGLSIRDRRIQEEHIDRQGLRLILNDVSCPILDVMFIESGGGRGHLKSYIEEWIATIEIIIRKSNKNE